MEGKQTHRFCLKQTCQFNTIPPPEGTQECIGCAYLKRKSIKVFANTWLELDALRGKGETFEDVIKRLLLIESRVRSLQDV